MKTWGTTVTFRKRSDGALTGYEVSGHAGYAEAGADIVCAAISALTQATLNGLRNILKVPVMFDQDDEGAFLEANLTPEATEDQVERAQLLLQTLLEGLRAIQREYPRNLRIILRERR